MDLTFELLKHVQYCVGGGVVYLDCEDVEKVLEFYQNDCNRFKIFGEEDYYILQFDVQTALKVSDHILDTIERLEQFPDSGSAIPDDWLNEQGYRMVICKKHIAIYRVIHETVYVYHIADTQTDYTKLF